MSFEYTLLIETYTPGETVNKVNKLAGEGWRFMFISGNVYWFERATDKAGTESETVTGASKQKNKSAAADKK